MTKIDLYELLRAIERREEQEDRLCNDYCELNPEDAERRRRDRDLIRYALMLVRLDINEYVRKVINDCDLL